MCGMILLFAVTMSLLITQAEKLFTGFDESTAPGPEPEEQLVPQPAD